MRPDIYLEAMKDMGVTVKAPAAQKFSFFDGTTFDPAADPEKYARSFPINSLAG
jgi:hypothetical protein